MLDPQRLREPETERIMGGEDFELGEVERISAGLELSASKVGPPAPCSEHADHAATKIVPRLGVDKGGSRTASAAEHGRHAAAKKRILLIEPAHADREPVATESLVGGNGGEAIGRADRARLNVLPDVTAFCRDGEAGVAELVANRHAAVAFGGEARISGDVAGDQEWAGR